MIFSIKITGTLSLLKYIFAILMLSAIIYSCTTTEASLADKKNYAETDDEYRRKFNYTLDSTEKVIRYGYYYVVSTVPEGFRVRVFHPDEKVMTEEKTYSTSALTLLHGEYKGWWDDGSFREQGFYQYGRKHGTWLEKEPGQGKSASGEYANDRKDGLWTQLDTNGMIESVYTWKDGKRHGKFLLYDGFGQKVNEGLFKNDTLISELFKQPVMVKPYLRSCENGDFMDVETCTDIMLPQYLYSTVKYPSEARKNKIQGSVFAQWDVLADGTVTNIRVPQSLSNEIKNEVIRVLSRMPAWAPGTKDGKPIKWTVSLPVRFSS